MKILDPDQSWELFLKKAFIHNTDGKCPEELESIGREILRKCNGLPLAIIVIGGLLVKQGQTRSGWEKVLKEMNSRFGKTGSSVVATLELSYQHLPSQLKSCFLCLSFFKEDAIIDVEKLTQVWVAQGLIPERGGGESFEDIARSYLDELINRNLVQVKDMSIDGRVKTCVVHDLLRELAIEKAKEDISLEIVREEGNSQSSNKPRHRIIHCSTGERLMLCSENRNKHVRSLFFHGTGEIASGPSYWKSFELLRTLDFEDLELRIALDSIGALIGLRYLGLRNSRIGKIPSSFGCLVNLEVLDIYDNHYVVEVPNVLWKMISLRQFYMYNIICEGTLKIDTLKNLRTLSSIPMPDIAVEHLSQLTSLCELGIWIDSKSDARKLCGSLAMLENLVSLHLKSNIIERFPLLEDRLGTLQRITQLKLEGPLPNLPSTCNFPPNLSFLSLMFTYLSEDPMLVLEKLPKLSCLELNRYSYIGQDMTISRDGFPRLNLLSLHQLWNLCSINVEEGAMPELKQLEINECLNLGSDMLTQVVKSVSSNLQALKVVTTPEIASKLRDEGAHRISNIPSVDIIGDPSACI